MGSMYPEPASARAEMTSTTARTVSGTSGSRRRRRCQAGEIAIMAALYGGLRSIRVLPGMDSAYISGTIRARNRPSDGAKSHPEGDDERRPSDIRWPRTIKEGSMNSLVELNDVTKIYNTAS